MKADNNIYVFILLILCKPVITQVERSEYMLQTKYSTVFRSSQVNGRVLNLSECAVRCHNNYKNCSAFSFNSQTLSCYLGQCVITQPAFTPSISNYHTQQPSCDLSSGFEIETNGHTSACLWWSNVTKNFTDAKLDCQAKGSTLATFKTLEKFQILQQHSKVASYYIGLDDMAEEGVYRWHDDGSILDPSYVPQIYLPGEPNNYNYIEDCNYVAFGYGRLNDYPCYWIMNYVCEKVCYQI